MKRLAITGSNGTIGTILRRGLPDYDITHIDLPEIDVRNYDQLLEVFPGHDAIIHLARDPRGDFLIDRISTDSILMTDNVYRAAVSTSVPRVIMASSVHADSYENWERPELMDVNRIPIPDTPYGASKITMEALGRLYGGYRGLEVVCIRFGGVNPEDRADMPEEGYTKIWLSHKDCIELVKTCIEAPQIPDKFLIIYGVSNNSSRVHDYANPFGWTPQDDADRTKMKGK